MLGKLTLVSTVVSAIIFALIGYYAVEQNPMHAGIGAAVGGAIGFVEAKILGGILAKKKAQLKGSDHE